MYPVLNNLWICTRMVIGVSIYPQARDKPHYVILSTWSPSVTWKAEVCIQIYVGAAKPQ